jgi:hypothetical protein
MLTPNTNCIVCGSRFYASPGHVAQGWGQTCSINCRSKAKPNPRFIENDVSCKCCGKAFHVKPSQEKLGKGRTYCSSSCRKMATQAVMLCKNCKKEIVIPKSRVGKVSFCSMRCRRESAACATPNCKCKACGKDFYLKVSDINRGNGAGTFCSVGCMTNNKNKIKLEDGEFASYLEAELFFMLKSLGLNVGMMREFRFHETRRWRFDFAWPAKKIAAEVHGGIWLGKSGGHTSGKGRARDMEKINEAAVLGWRVLELTPDMIRSGEAVRYIERVMAG